MPYLALTPTDREGIPNQLDCSQFQFNSVGFWCLDVRKSKKKRRRKWVLVFGCEKQKQEKKVKIARRKREEVIPIARRRPASCQEERERERFGGEGGTGGWKRKVAITIAKEIKDARVKKKKKIVCSCVNTPYAKNKK